MSSSDSGSDADGQDEADEERMEETLEQLKAEIQKEKSGAAGPAEEKALAKAEGLVNRLEGTLKEVRRN